MKSFRLININPPGRINLMGRGTVTLSDLTDEQAAELYKSGCRYLEPVPEPVPEDTEKPLKKNQKSKIKN